MKSTGDLFANPLDRGLISIVVPLYNAGDYIHDFFNSILTQSYKNLEIIIVEDCSTDKSFNIAKEYAAKDERIKLVQQKENGGVGRALARGYGMATGDFCSTMSPDDTVDMFYYENLIQKYRETKSDVICARMLATQNNYMFSDGQDFTFYPFAAKLAAAFYFYMGLITRKLLIENDIWNASMTERHWEDAIIKCKVCYHANHISFCHKAVRFYTIRKSSLSHQPTDMQLEYQKTAESRTSDFLHSVGIDDVRIKIVGGFKLVGTWDINSWFAKQNIVNKDNHKKYKRLFNVFLLLSIGLLCIIMFQIFA